MDAVAASEWQGGQFRTVSDDRLLAAAAAESRILVTYDCQTIPLLLKEWAETGRRHQGVILVDDRSIRPNDIEGMVRALRAVVGSDEAGSWEDRVVFLRPLRSSSIPNR